MSPDALLIAAAPDLLHNLVGLTTVVEAMAASGKMFEPQQLRRVLDLARAAIAKAEGGS